MNQEFVLGKLADLMSWNEDQARREFAWLRLMSRMKYDGYQDFLAGMRFIESLADWLQQFQATERRTAYQFVRQRLVFISAAEMRHLVELFYPETVQPRLIRRVAELKCIQPYQVWADDGATRLYETLLRKTLFIELSDGAQIDIFRRANEGIIGHEQVITSPRIIKAKWNELLDKLRKATGDDDARFAFVFLVDDFVGSGYTLLREGKNGWDGKLHRFWEDVRSAGVLESHFDEHWTLCVHHYVSTHRAHIAIEDCTRDAGLSLATDRWFRNVEFTCGTLLPPDFAVNLEDCPDFGVLVQKYYNGSIETPSMKEGGGDARLGFNKGALPLILEHNTPNNSIALLWAEADGNDGKYPMRPLFRRRQRHV